MRKDLGVVSNETVKSVPFPSDYSSSLDTDFDVEEPKQDDFLKEINEFMPTKDELSDLNSAFDDILEDKKVKKKK